MKLPEWILADLFLPMAGEMGFREEHRIDPLASVGGFSDCLGFPNVTRGLLSRGYSDDEIAGILGGSFLRVFEKVCG